MGLRHTYFGWWKDQQGAVINGEMLTVYLAGTTTAAAIYTASSGGSAITNAQITLSDVGYFKFWVDEDDYGTTQRFKLSFTGNKFDSLVVDDIEIFPGITASSTDTLTNKTLTTPTIGDFTNAGHDHSDAANGGVTLQYPTITIKDSYLLLADDLDDTKNAAFQLAGITTGTTRVFTFPDTDDTLAVLDLAQTLTNKTLTLPVIGDFTNAGHDHSDAANGGVIDVSTNTPYILLADEKATTTDGGTFTAGAWQKRTIAEVYDTGSNCSVASSVITLGAGTYNLLIRCPAYAVNNHQARLRNTTDGTTEFLGGNMYAPTTQNDSIIQGRLVVASQKDYEIQHYCGTTKATDGYGRANSFGENEIYTVAEFWKVA